MKVVAADVLAAVTLDPENPWLGLSSYTEETRAYFHGRDEEAAELARRVQRKLLTVLFGQSGLGKTSLLRAGLVPKLRGEGFCPVYVRVDYSPESPAPAEQIKQAIFKATADAGHWTRPGTAVEGESLWEFLHHRGDLLRDASGATVLPLLIFDQFEEIFTLAQLDDAGRLRAREFLEELADLVENRPPADLETRLDRDEVDAAEFDFARADYRILIALREDYLAHLESVKGIMPSITQNRMRLARMTGTQALSAVQKPGGRLVSQEVAESIVRFVAGGSELDHAEVEPSLLSLICRELNTVRLAQGRAEISADLLAGSRDTILSEFYERTLADQPAGVRRVIEDELLTDSGYRESLAEERVVKALAATGASADTLATLVNRRLLRIEERLDMRRVELTHDVLCSVVKSSRDLRHEREARDEAERQLAAQHERAAETRRTLRRTRRFAVIAACLMLIAVGSAVFGWINLGRARAADAAAQQARADAEGLVAFLVEDFYEELEPTGRLETMGKLAHMAVTYYDGLPDTLLTPQTRIYRGMALIREGHALLAKGSIEEANRNLDEAHAVFEKLRASGDASETVAVGLALSKFTRFAAWGVIGAPGSKPGDLQEAAQLLRPLVAKPDASRKVKLVYADILNYLSHQHQSKEQAVADCEEARGILVGLGARNLTDLSAASVYADTSDSQARHALYLGRIADAEKLEREVYDMAEKVLLQRPGDFRSMQNRTLASGLLSALAAIRHDYTAAADYAAKSEEAADAYVRFNPANLAAWDYAGNGKWIVADAAYEQGMISDALAKFREAAAMRNDPRAPSSLLPLLRDQLAELAKLEAMSGQAAAAAATFKLRQQGTAEAIQPMSPDDPARFFGLLGDQLLQARMEFLAGNYEPAYQLATTVVQRVKNREPTADDRPGQMFQDDLLRNSVLTSSQLALRLGRFADAEALARESQTLPRSRTRPEDPQDAISAIQVLMAHAMAMQGRAEEARQLLQPELARYRDEQAGGARGLTYQTDFAYALYVQSIVETDASRRLQSLNEASGLLKSLTPEAQQLVGVRELADWIAIARNQLPN